MSDTPRGQRGDVPARPDDDTEAIVPAERSPAPLGPVRVEAEARPASASTGDSSASGESIDFELPARFEVKGTLGRGGMGVVLEAHDAMLARDVAVKVLPRSLRENAALVPGRAKEGDIKRALRARRGPLQFSRSLRYP